MKKIFEYPSDIAVSEFWANFVNTQDREGVLPDLCLLEFASCAELDASSLASASSYAAVD
jgi:hypothetical protein